MSVRNFGDEEFTSDDSVADPDFNPDLDDCNNKLQRMIRSLNSSSVTETAAIPTNIQPPVKRRQKGNLKFKRLTKEEKVARGKETHPMKPPCLEKCDKKCGSTFSKEERFGIWEQYWSLEYSSRRKWLAKKSK